MSDTIKLGTENISRDFCSAIKDVLVKYGIDDRIDNRKVIAVLLADIGFQFLDTVDDIEETSQRINGLAEDHIEFLKNEIKVPL